MSDVFDETDLFYSYAPSSLLKSWERLALQESELLTRTSLTANLLQERAILMTENGRLDKVTVAAAQISGAGLPASDVSGFCFRAELAIDQAVKLGANILVLPELWSGPYFTQSQEPALMGIACELDDSILIRRMQQLSRLYGVVLVSSFYERKNQALYSSAVVIDLDGSIAGVYRKSQIRNSSGFYEKSYFAPGDTGCRVVMTKVCRIGVAIGYDQFFPECARSVALQGANILVIPSAMGSDPKDADCAFDASYCRRAVQGQAAANLLPTVYANRSGTEILCDTQGIETRRINYYGQSFVASATGEVLAECAEVHTANSDKVKTTEQPVIVVTAEIDVAADENVRLAMGLFRDRRPDLYAVLLTMDGRTNSSQSISQNLS